MQKFPSYIIHTLHHSPSFCCVADLNSFFLLLFIVFDPFQLLTRSIEIFSLEIITEKAEILVIDVNKKEEEEEEMQTIQDEMLNIIFRHTPLCVGY